jgi:hypothetical protein
MWVAFREEWPSAELPEDWRAALRTMIRQAHDLAPDGRGH